MTFHDLPLTSHDLSRRAQVLFPPLTGLEVLNTEVDHSTLVVVTRLSLNMASLTLEQVLAFR